MLMGFGGIRPNHLYRLGSWVCYAQTNRMTLSHKRWFMTQINTQKLCHNIMTRRSRDLLKWACGRLIGSLDKFINLTKTALCCYLFGRLTVIGFRFAIRASLYKAICYLELSMSYGKI